MFCFFIVRRTFGVKTSYIALSFNQKKKEKKKELLHFLQRGITSTECCWLKGWCSSFCIVMIHMFQVLF